MFTVDIDAVGGTGQQFVFSNGLGDLGRGQGEGDAGGCEDVGSGELPGGQDFLFGEFAVLETARDAGDGDTGLAAGGVDPDFHRRRLERDAVTSLQDSLERVPARTGGEPDVAGCDNMVVVDTPTDFPGPGLGQADQVESLVDRVPQCEQPGGTDQFRVPGRKPVSNGSSGVELPGIATVLSIEFGRVDVEQQTAWLVPGALFENGPFLWGNHPEPRRPGRGRETVFERPTECAGVSGHLQPDGPWARQAIEVGFVELHVECLALGTDPGFQERIPGQCLQLAWQDQFDVQHPRLQ